MRKRFPILLCIIFILSGCGKDTPTTPDIPKPKADVRIAISVDPFLFFYEPTLGYYWSIFNVILSEHNGVRATITTLKLEFRDGTTLVATVTYSGGTLPANGSLNIACSPVVWFSFDEMKIIVTGEDANGYEINVSETYTWVTTVTGQLKAIKK